MPVPCWHPSDHDCCRHPTELRCRRRRRYCCCCCCRCSRPRYFCCCYHCQAEALPTLLLRATGPERHSLGGEGGNIVAIAARRRGMRHPQTPPPAAFAPGGNLIHGSKANTCRPFASARARLSATVSRALRQIRRVGPRRRSSRARQRLHWTAKAAFTLLIIGCRSQRLPLQRRRHQT